MPQTLTIGDLTIHPYAYRETKHYTGQGASIRLRVKLSPGTAAFTDVVLRRLLERLVAKGVLTANERKGMESSAEDLVGIYLVEISEVDDIDVEPFDSVS